MEYHAIAREGITSSIEDFEASSCNQSDRDIVVNGSGDMEAATRRPSGRECARRTG
jgi:hypothetical protein